MGRFVAADASPLIALAASDTLDVLHGLFDTVTITRLVKDEVAGRGERPGAHQIDVAMRAGWLRVAPAPPGTWRFTELDAGEASTIALAAEHEGALVLMDDALGRAQATALKLEVIDVAGLLLTAKRAALIDAVQPIVARLARLGFTMPEAARHALLRDAGEAAAGELGVSRVRAPVRRR